MTEKEKVDLDGCTFHGDSIEEHFVRKSNQETQRVIKEEIKEKKNPNPIYRSPKYPDIKERNGIMQNITQEHKNKRVSSNYDKCTNIKQAIISLLLSDAIVTSQDIFSTIGLESTHNPNLRGIVKTEKLNIQKIWNSMNAIRKTQLGRTALVIRKSDEGKFTKPRIYSFNSYGRNLTLEEAMDLCKEKRTIKKSLSKATIRKAVKKVKEQREVFNGEQLKFLNKMLSQIVLKEDFKKYIEDLNGQLESIKNIPETDNSKKLGKTINHSVSINDKRDKLAVEISGGVHFTFKFISD